MKQFEQNPASRGGGSECGSQNWGRWPAQRRGDVTPLKYEAPFGQPVEVRRFGVGMAHEPIIRPSLVIAKNEDDIGWLICEGCESKSYGDAE